MDDTAAKDEQESWLASSSAKAEEGYDAWLAAEIEDGCAELDAGKGIAASEVWKRLGLE